MGYTPEQINTFHASGKTPTWIWAQQNGRTAQYNYYYQKQKIYNSLNNKAAAEKIKEQFNKKISAAVIDAILQTEDIVAEETANDIISSINAALNGGTITTSNSKHTLSAEIGAMLGRELGKDAFNILNDLFGLDDE